MQTREQEYAVKINGQVGKLLKPEIPQGYCDVYGSLAHKLPVLIRTAGLAQGLAFVASRKNETYRREIQALNTAARKQMDRAAGNPAGPDAAPLEEDPYRQLMRDLAATLHYKDESALLSASQTAQLDAYMHLTRRALAALLWYKRFAESVLDVTADTDTEAEAVPGAPPAAPGGAA